MQTDWLNEPASRIQVLSLTLSNKPLLSTQPIDPNQMGY
jgi:hypothetical protein